MRDRLLAETTEKNLGFHTSAEYIPAPNGQEATVRALIGATT